MGYFSEAAAEGGGCEDLSYPTPELQIKWRIEDLEEIAKRFDAARAGRQRGRKYTQENFGYTLPECFSRREDILAAIAEARHRLAQLEAEETEPQGKAVIKTPGCDPVGVKGQLSMWDIEMPNLPGPDLKQAA